MLLSAAGLRQRRHVGSNGPRVERGLDDAGHASLRVDHSASMAVLDPQGRMAGIVQPPFDALAIAADMTALTQAGSR